jgi:zinc transport system ATP-binding protein
LDWSLVVKYQGKEIFTSRGKWLYPLFELEDLFVEKDYPREELDVVEKVAGQAAAFLIARLGIKKCHIKLISEKAIPVFKRFGISFTYDEKVPLIQCRTEHILEADMSPDDAWQILRRRAGRVHGTDVMIEKLEIDLHRQIIIDGLDMEVKRGEGMIICGENGVGKTTLLKAILGLQPISSGTIKIGDLQVGSQIWNKNRHITGYVNQERIKGIFPVSASEVVEIGLSGRKLSKAVIKERIESAMKRTGCLELASRSYHKLSGGEKQRVSLARCLCQQARVLLFDEPTTFLDPRARDDLHKLLIELWEHEAPTMIVVSHDDNWINKFQWEVKELKGGKLC